MRVVIIEDEPKTARDLAKTISKIVPEASFVSFIESVEEGLAFFSKPINVDLIFSDIQLGDGLSFEIFENRSIHIPIIFCTAYDEYALKAFQTAGIDYILKPFSLDAVQGSLAKFQNLTQRSQQRLPELSSLIETIKKELQGPKRPSIVIHKGDKIYTISTEDIALFHIEYENVFAYTFDNKKTLVDIKLDDLEIKCCPTFYRANRQCLVNRKAVKDASLHFNRKLLLGLHINFQEPILISKEKKTDFLEWLSNE